jgi:peptide/nickel transport system permease protein
MTRWFLTAGVVAVLTVVVRFGRIIQLLTTPSPETIAPALGALALPVLAFAGWRWSRQPAAGHGVLHRLVRNRTFLWGSGVVAVLILAALLAPVLTSFDPNAQPDLRAATQTPSPAHPFGTDFYNRDVLSRVLHGARWSLGIAVASVTLLVVIGTVVGLTAGLARGAVDVVLMRMVDAGLAIPRILLLLVVAAMWGNLSFLALATLLGLTGWFGLSRIVRAEVLSLRGRPFVAAAEALGVGRKRLIVRHLLPNLAAPISVTAALGVGNIILIEASLSYLGLGAPPPDPGWGNIIREGMDIMLSAPWVAFFPGVAIFLTVAGFSLIGDSLRSALDPQAQ